MSPPEPTARLRSVLYIPGANPRALEKARDLAADGLILDLEDAVAPGAKAPARDRVAGLVSDGYYGERTVVIRVNGLDTEWHRADVTAAAAARPHAVLVPKVGSADDVEQIIAALDAAGAADDVRLWAMLETPAAMLAAREICGAAERLDVLVMGTNDLARELFAELVPGREPLLAALSLCLLAARATGRRIIDGVYNDVRDPDGFEAECRQGRRLGFDGKTLIHPGQVEICNRVWSPSAEEIQHARRVIEAFAAAEAAGAGVATVDGRLIENLHVANAQRVLAMADPDTAA